MTTISELNEKMVTSVSYEALQVEFGQRHVVLVVAVAQVFSIGYKHSDDQSSNRLIGPKFKIIVQNLIF